MSLGLKRAKFGDIILSGDQVQFYCSEEVSHFVTLELHSIGKASIQLIELPLLEGLVCENVWNEQRFNGFFLKAGYDDFIDLSNFTTKISNL